MSISYLELAQIGAMTNEKLVQEYEYLSAQTSPIRLNEDGLDRLNAIETEMESREMPHP